MIISFLRAFRATRRVKDKLGLVFPDGGRRLHYAFAHCDEQFSVGQRVAVEVLRTGGALVVTDGGTMGEVVLDDARPGLDFEVISCVASEGG